MSIASRLKNAVTPLDAVSQSIEDRKASEADLASLATEGEALQSKRADLLRKAGEARRSKDTKQYDAIKNQIADIDRDLVFNAELQQDARDNILAANERAHAAMRDGRIKEAEKLKRQSAKHATEADEAAQAYVAAVNRLYTSRDRLRQFFVGTGIQAPNNTALTRREVNEIIGRVIFKHAPWSGIGQPEENLLPGAIMPPPLSGGAAAIPSIADALAPHDDRILRVIAEGPYPKRIAAPVAEPTANLSLPPTEPAHVALNDVAPVSEGPTIDARTVPIRRNDISHYVRGDGNE